MQPTASSSYTEMSASLLSEATIEAYVEQVCVYASIVPRLVLHTHNVHRVIANYIHVSATGKQRHFLSQQVKCTLITGLLNLVVLVYDTLVTLDREITQVWKGGSVWFAVLYCANRYCAIANRVMVILERVQWKGQTIQVCFCLMATWILLTDVPVEVCVHRNRPKSLPDRVKN